MSSPRDVNVRASLDPSKYEAGAERVTWATKQMLRQQEAADRKWRSMQGAHQAALNDEARRQAAAAKAVQDAESRKAIAMDRTGKAALAGGAMILTGLGLASKAAVEWESAWTGVTKTVDADAEGLAKIEKGLRGLTGVLPASHQEIAAVAEAAGQLGVQSTAIVGFTRTMIDLGETTNLSADTAATAIAQMANVMDPALLQSGDGVQRLGSTLVALGNAGASTEADIMATATRISGAGKLVGASADEVLALASALTSMGITAELGGGVASRVLQDLYTAVSSGGAELQGFADVAGLSAGQFAEAFRADPVRALAAFASGLNGVEASGGNVVQTLRDLGFTSSEEQRVLLQLKGAQDLLVDSLDLANGAWQENAALVAEAAKRYDTTEAKLQIARNSLNDAAISIGDAFLPMLADAATQVAGLAQAFASLPQPVQQTVAALGSVVGVTSMLAGGALLVVPRLAEATKTLRDLGVISPRVASGLGRVATGALKVGGAAAGIATLATALGSIAEANYMRRIDEGMGRVAKAVAEASKASNAAGLDQIFVGRDGAAIVDQVDSLDAALRRTFSPDAGQRFDDWGQRLVAAVTPIEGSTQILEDAWGRLDQQLADMVGGGNTELAGQTFALVRERAVELGYSVEQLAAIFPTYSDALASADAQQQTAGASAQSMAGGLEQTASATEEASEALEKWVEQTAEAFASFIDPGGAFQAAIDKQREQAEVAADKSKSSKDSWEDFYDGTSVSARQYIGQLQKQVQAQESWASNMTALSGRVNKRLPADMRDAANAMIDELIQLGPEGAAQVKLLHDMSDAQLAKVVGLYGRKGAASGQAFADEINSTRPDPIPVNANISPATAKTAELQRYINQQRATLGVSADTQAAQMAINRLRNQRSIVVGVTAVTAKATGGAVYGGERGRDSVHALLMPGEHVLTTKDVEALGGQAGVYALRASLHGRRMEAYAAGGGGGEAERDRRERLREAMLQLRKDLRRGEVRSSATGGLSGAYGVVDEMFSLAGSGDLSKGRSKQLRAAAADAERSMRILYRRAEGIEKRLEAARDRVQELAAIKASVGSALAGGFSLGDVSGVVNPFTGTAEAGGGQRMLAAAQGYAAKVRAFAGKLQALQKKGFSGVILQEIAAMGVTVGPAAADALLSLSAADTKSLNQAYRDVETWSNRAGEAVTGGFYKGGLAAAEGLVKGLESQDKAVQDAIVRLAKSMEKALKRALGIKSPSKVFRDLMHHVGDGAVQGLGDKRAAIETAARDMLRPAAVVGYPRPQFAVAGPSSVDNSSTSHLTVNNYGEPVTDQTLLRYERKRELLRRPR